MDIRSSKDGGVVRVKYPEHLDGYIERNESNTWSWGIYNVPVNRGLCVQGQSYLKIIAQLRLHKAKRLARIYGFRP